MAKRLKTGYRGVVTAKPGTYLLGGTQIHESILFRNDRNATRWAVIVAQTNKDAGRKVDRVFVQYVERGVVIRTYD